MKIKLVTPFSKITAEEVEQIPAIIYNLQERSCHNLHPDEIYLPHTSYCLFVFVALRPMSTAVVIAGRSVHLTTLFPGQA